MNAWLLSTGGALRPGAPASCREPNRPKAAMNQWDASSEAGGGPAAAGLGGTGSRAMPDFLPATNNVPILAGLQLRPLGRGRERSLLCFSFPLSFTPPPEKLTGQHVPFAQPWAGWGHADLSIPPRDLSAGGASFYCRWGDHQSDPQSAPVRDSLRPERQSPLLRKPGA